MCAPTDSTEQIFVLGAAFPCFQVQRSPLLAARLLFCAVLNNFFQGFKALVKVQLAGIHQHSVFGLAQRGCCTVGILIVARADIGQNILVVVLFAFHQQLFIAALCAGFLFTMNPYLIFWTGSVVAAVQLVVLAALSPEKNAALTSQYEVQSETLKESKTPSFGEIIGVFKLIDVWKMIVFVIMSWTFYTVFDQQMFPEFFTRFFATPEEGQQAYGVLNSVQVFLEFIMMSLVPILMRKIGVRRALLLGCLIMVCRISGCGIASTPLGIALIKLLHAPETALFVLAIFRYFTLHFDTRVSATLYMVGFQIAASVGGIIFSVPLGSLRDSIGYQHTFLLIAGIVLCATVYAFLILKKDDQDVEGQPLEN